nr:hypothetical protein [Tanacetum cinerariifolium]
SCGNGAHIGYNCPLKVSIISNPEPCPNQNVDVFPQTLPSFHPTCYSGDENSFAYDSTPNFVDNSPNVFNPPPQPRTNSYEFCGNDAHYSHYCPPQIEPDQGELTSVVMEDNLGEPRVHVPNVLPIHPTLMLDSDFIPFDNSLPESEISALILKRRIVAVPLFMLIFLFRILNVSILRVNPIRVTISDYTFRH